MTSRRAPFSDNTSSIIATFASFKNRFRRRLWTDLYETLTHDNRTVRWDFWSIGPLKIWDQKLYLFSTTSQLSGKFEGQYLRGGTWYRQSSNDISNYERFPISFQIFMNFGPLTAKVRPQFSPTLRKFPQSSAWRRRTSRWPALRRANISSYVL